MRKVIASEFMALDGVIQEPMWTFKYTTEEILAIKKEELFSADALLLGRVTYEGFAAAWPGRTDEAGYGDRMNSMPKYVVSTTLEEAEWENSRLIKEDVAEEVRKLKQETGGDILIFGSRKLLNGLMEEDLVDEFTILVYPVVIGEGDRLFDDGKKESFKLIESKAFDSGVVLLRYKLDREEAQSQ